LKEENDTDASIKRGAESERRKKVCFLITGLGTGGAETHLVQILPRLKENVDFFVVSLTNLDTKGKELEKAGIIVHYLGLKNNALNLIAVISRLRKIIKK
jgi:uncharacterized protein (DUF58 family)